jgi:hypothetical protein
MFCVSIQYIVHSFKLDIRTKVFRTEIRFGVDLLFGDVLWPAGYGREDKNNRGKINTELRYRQRRET